MDILVSAHLPHVSGFAEDTFVNNFAVKTAPGWVGDGTDLGEVTFAIAQFWTHTNGGGFQVGDYISPGVSRVSQACRLKVYDLTGHLDGSPHGSPINEDGFTMPAASIGVIQPEEVALVLTLRADGWEEALVETSDGPDAGTAVDRPRQRFSGRIYVGPFHANANEADAASKARPKVELRTVMLDAIEKVQDDLAIGGHTLGVWSRVGQGIVPITHAQVDNAWDTQRRRGVAPTIRTTRTLVP